MPDLTLEFSNLEVQRGDRLLFSRLSGAVSSHELLFVKGENGSGKSTLLRCLAGLYAPDEGTVCWQGQELGRLGEEYRRNLLYLGHLNGIKANLTALENLRFLCTVEGSVHGNRDIQNALHKMGLAGFEDVPARMLSQGQKRRIALSRLMLSTAALWVLDEPFTALDVHAVEMLQSVISAHLENGGIVVITTHQETPLTTDSSRTLWLGRQP